MRGGKQRYRVSVRVCLERMNLINLPLATENSRPRRIETTPTRSMYRRQTVIAALMVGFLAPAICADLPLLEGQGDVPTLAPLVDRVAPAVVNISVRSRSPAEENPLFSDPFFRRFFNLPQNLPPRTHLSAGSGVIIDARRGLVITNEHVIANGEEIVVTLRDRRNFNAELIGSDPATDIALLKIAPDDLTELPLGNSDDLKVGDYVAAIGNPFGLGQTVTAGIVSALGRTGLTLEGYEDFIQTDAPINPGNSGGALITLTGEFIGINAAIIAPAGGNIGIGFAIPSNMARAVVEQLIEHGEVHRGRLGVTIQDLTPDIAKAMGVRQTRGAVVREVQAGSSADKVGIRAGDIVIEFNGRALRSSSDLRNSIGLAPPGTSIELTLLRDGKRKKVRARLTRVDAESAYIQADASRLRGARFQDLERNRFSGQTGVLVAEVQNHSPAWLHGLRDGDVIVAVNRKAVGSISQLKAALEQAGPVILLDVVRDDTDIFIIVQ